MTPTNKLRFVERQEIIDGFSVDDHSVVRTVRVLQQWWDAEEGDYEDYVNAGGEWRDVPLEEEE